MQQAGFNCLSLDEIIKLKFFFLKVLISTFVDNNSVRYICSRICEKVLVLWKNTPSGRMENQEIQNPEAEAEPEPEPEHSFQWDWVWDDALIIQLNIFAFASRSRQHRGIGWEVSLCDKFLVAQFVQNQNINTVKTCLAFATIDRNAEILSGGFNDRLSCCWMYWLFVNFWLSGKFLNNRARESRFFLIQYTEAKRICVKQKHNIL